MLPPLSTNFGISDKKKKEGGAKEDDGAIPILGDLAKRVKNIEGKITMPKGILKKVVCNVSSDTHEVVMPLNDVGSGSKVNFEAVGKSNANSSSYTTDIHNLGSDLVGLATNEELSGDAATNIDKPSSSSGAQRNSFASLLRSNEANNKVHFRTLVNEERVGSVDYVLPKAAAAKVKSRFEKITRNDDGVYLFKFASKSSMDQVLEKGPWMIRKSPIILNKWSPSVSLKKVTMAISDEEVHGYTKEVIRVVYEWKPPHCVDCQSFGHDTNLCPKHVREEIPKTSATDAKANTMDENDDGFVEQKKGVDAKGGSNSASPSVSTNDNEKGNGCLKLDLNLSNPFDVLNVEGEEMGDSGQQPKVSEHVGTKSLNVNKKKAQEPSSSKSAINDVQKDKNVSSSPALKTWDCINESDTDDEDVIPSYGSSLGGGNQLEDKDFDFSDGYEDQVVDFPSQLKEFRDFKLSMCGRK
ncbi:retrovirus-related pol polyprotein from transposon TNT 1-94 [Tanacetum coccineum]